MKEKYDEGRFGVVIEEIRDALVGIETQLERINDKLGGFAECVDTRIKKPVLRVADINKEI